MPVKVGNIEIHMGPRQVGAPDDLLRPIVDFIDGAKRRLDVAVQELDSKEIAKAILRARARKVSVRVVLEADYLRANKATSDPWRSGGQHEVNREIQNAVLRTGINVWADFNPSIFHQKFMVRDGSAVLTGSTNFTDTGTHNNLNHVVVIKDRKVANIYAKEFREIRQGHFGKLNEGHDRKPRRVEVSGVPIKVLFAPDHAPEMEIMKQMAKASERIDFAVFTFSRSSGIDDQMVLVSGLSHPVAVRGVLDARQANQKWAATKLVRKAGIPIWLVKKQRNLGKLHHKLMVLDRQVIIAGSFNYTGPANLTNDENIIIIGDLEASTAAVRNKQKKLARYALDEIDRIIQDHGAKVA